MAATHETNPTTNEVINQDLNYLIISVILIDELIDRWSTMEKKDWGCRFEDFEVNGELPESLLKVPGFKEVNELTGKGTPFDEITQKVVKGKPRAVEIDFDEINGAIARLKDVFEKDPFHPQKQSTFEATLAVIDLWKRSPGFKELMAEYNISID